MYVRDGVRPPTFIYAWDYVNATSELLVCRGVVEMAGPHNWMCTGTRDEAQALQVHSVELVRARQGTVHQLVLQLRAVHTHREQRIRYPADLPRRQPLHVRVHVVVQQRNKRICRMFALSKGCAVDLVQKVRTYLC